jgi:hypothetical protein
LGVSDTGEYQANGGAWVPFTTSGAKVVANPAALDGYTLNIRHVAGNGFGVTSLEIDAVVLPEPTSVGLIAFALGGLRLFRRRK